MWMLFAICSMVLCAMGEIISRKIIQENAEIGPLIVYSASSFFCFLFAIAMWLSGMGESGAAPLGILAEHPLIILSTISTFLAVFLMLAAFRYIGVSVESVISGVSAIFLFGGLIYVNLFLGKLDSVKEILVPQRLIPMIVIIVLIFLLSNTDNTAVNTIPGKKTHKKHTAMTVGILIMLVSCIFDASDSLIVSYCVAENQVGIMDYFIATNFLDILFGLICFITAVIKIKKTKISYQFYVKKIPVLLVLGIFSIGSMLTYLIGSGYDAVKFAVFYIVYPVVPLIGARLLLKERYTAKQYFCIFGIAAASVVFGLSDYM